jgi:hypothetical protein
MAKISYILKQGVTYKPTIIFQWNFTCTFSNFPLQLYYVILGAYIHDYPINYKYRDPVMW